MVNLDDVPSEGKSFLRICPDSSGFLESKTRKHIANCMHLHGVFEGQSIVTSTDIPRNHLIKGTTSNKKLHFSADFAGSAACQTCMDGASCEPDSNGIYSNLGPNNKGRGIKGAQRLAIEVG